MERNIIWFEGAHFDCKFIHKYETHTCLRMNGINGLEDDEIHDENESNIRITRYVDEMKCVFACRVDLPVWH